MTNKDHADLWCPPRTWAPLGTGVCTYETKEYYAKEIRRGAFSRAFRLPRSVDATKATAQFERGILTIIAPAVPDTKRNAVQVPINGI